MGTWPKQALEKGTPQYSEDLGEAEKSPLAGRSHEGGALLTRPALGLPSPPRHAPVSPRRRPLALWLATALVSQQFSPQPPPTHSQYNPHFAAGVGVQLLSHV